MTREELRKRRFENIQLIYCEVGDSEFTKRLELSPGRKNQLLKGHGTLGDQMARRIEGAFGFMIGWLDNIHEDGILAEDRDVTEDYIASRLEELVTAIENIPEPELRNKMLARCLKSFSRI